MSPYSVIVLLGQVIKNLFFKVPQLKNQARALKFSGNITNMPKKITVPIFEANFQLLHKKPYYHPTLHSVQYFLMQVKDKHTREVHKQNIFFNS